MARLLLWRDLSVEQVEEYLSLRDAKSRIDFLRSNVQLPEHPETAEILLDLYQYTLQFAERQNFTADKVSVVFSVIKDTHEKSMEKFWPTKRSFTHFKELLLQHSVQRPPYSTGLFSLNDVMAITTFFSNGYFRHYMLYKYAFTKKTEMAMSTVYSHTLTVPANFLQPLQLGELEDVKLAREEKEALEKLNIGVVQVTPEEMAATGVPEDLQEKLLKEINEKLDSVHKSMETKFEAEHAALQRRIQTVTIALSPTKKAPVEAHLSDSVASTS